MKRIFTLLLATSLLIGALSACGSSNPEPETEPAEEQSVQEEEVETLDTDTSTRKETIYAVFKDASSVFLPRWVQVRKWRPKSLVMRL